MIEAPWIGNRSANGYGRLTAGSTPDAGVTGDHCSVCDRCEKALQVGEWPFCPHGFPERPGGTAMIDDQLPGGARLFENLGHEPVYVESKSQLRDEMRARGLMHRVEHRGVPGTDKSPQTQRWI